MNTKIKTTILALTICSAMVFFTSCTGNGKSEDAKDVAEEMNDDKFDSNKQEKDAQFLVNAAEINLEEIKLGQLAQEKGTSTHVKELGKMMEEMHGKAFADLSGLAGSKMVTIPTSLTDETMKSYNKLNEKSGMDFDKAYADMMVDGHKDAIKKFENAAEDSQDADIKNWAASSLPELRTHLEASEDCQEKCKAAK